MKGIILAGGHGTRLYPLTKVISKQLLPVYDKPMIYYPLSMLMLANIQEILIISDPQQMPAYEALLQTGEQWGLKFSYKIQEAPNGLAEAFILGEEFIGNDSVCMILGDNIFYGTNLPSRLLKAAELTKGAEIFAYEVKDPTRYGVVEVNEEGLALSLEEKPSEPKSNYAVPGLYFYDSRVVELAKSLKPSKRGELEITDLNRIYMDNKELYVNILGRGVAWLDAGLPDSLLKAAQFIQAIEERQGLMVSCPEEIAYRRGFIDISQLEELVKNLGKNEYREYLERMVSQEKNKKGHVK